MKQSEFHRPLNALLRPTALLLVLAGIFGTAMVTAQPVSESDAAALNENEERVREALMGDVGAYLRRIEAIENREGAFAPALSEDLLGLGLALQRSGQHPQAIEAFKRGIHLARINEGLYSQRQLALLKGEIASHIEMGSFEAADERQRYLYRVQARTLSDVSRGQALMQHALWQRQAYEAGVGEEPFARLINMWSLYRLALTEFAEVDGETSPTLIPPLYGMLRAQYLISGFVGETTSGRYRTAGIYGEEENQQMGYRSQSYKQGSAVIRAIYDVRVAQPEATLEGSARPLLMLGDWQLWHGKRSDALDTYAQLYGELEKTDAAKAVRERLFSKPAALPAIEGVRALPAPSPESEGSLLLEFGVSERGRVVDLVRLDDYAHNDEKADRIMGRLRRTPFRPRIDDGMPVDTEGLRWAYDTAQW